MLTATIIRDVTGTYHVRLSKKGPQIGGDVEVIEILLQKDGEDLEAFKDRCQRYVREQCP